MAIKFVSGNSISSVRSGVYAQIKENLSLDKINYVILPDSIVSSAKREILKCCNIDCAFNLKVVSFSSLAREFLQNSKQESLEECLIKFKLAAYENRDKLEAFGEIITNDGVAREIMAMINTLAESNIEPQCLMTAGERIGGILGEKIKDIAYLYKLYFERITNDKHGILKRLIGYFESNKISTNINFYLCDFHTITAEQLGCLQAIIMTRNNVVIGEVSGDNGGNNRLYPRFLNDFCVKLSEKYAIRLEYLTANDRLDNYKKVLLSGLYGFSDKPKSASCGSVEICYADDIALEVRGIARQIRKLVVEDGYRYKDITIFCPDINKYRQDIERNFNIFEIPYYMQTKANLSNFAVARLLLDCIKVIKTGYSKESLLDFSKNVLLGISNKEVNKFELFVIKYNIDKEQFLSYFEIAKDDSLYETANAVRMKLIKYISLLADFTSSGTALSTIYHFYDSILGENGYIDYLGRISSNGIKARKDCETAKDKLFEIFAMFEKIDFGRQNNDCVYDNICSVIENSQIGIAKQNIDSVQIIEDKKKVFACKQLFVMGANDGVLVGESNKIGLFNINELERLADFGVQFTPNILTINYNEKFEAIQLLSQGEKVCVSYNNELGEVSLLVKGIQNLLRIKSNKFIGDNNLINTKIQDYATKIGTKSNAISELAQYYSERMRGIATGDEKVFDYLYTKLDGGYKYQNVVLQKNFKKVKENTLAWSKSEDKSFARISAVEDYFNCPFKFFCDNVLRLKGVQKGGLDVMTFGSFAHRVLEKFFRKYKDYDLPEEEVYQISDNLSKQVIKEPAFVNISISYDDNILQKSLYKKMRYILLKVVEVAKRSDFETAFTELDFGNRYSKLPPYEIKTNDKSYYFRGVIDRVDKFGDYLAIIDYKSSSKVEYGLKEIYYGERVQLLIYLNAFLSCKEAVPFAVLYMPLPYSYSKEADGERTFKYSGLVLDMEDAISHFDKEYLGGSTLPISVKNEQLQDKGLLSQSELSILRDYADKVVGQAISEIESGYIEAKAINCDYCEYGQICMNKNNNFTKRKKDRKIVFSKQQNNEEEDNG